MTVRAVSRVGTGTPATYRVQRRTAATIVWRPVDQEGEIVDAVGTPTVTVTRADGTALVPAGTPALAAGQVSLPLTVSELATLDRLTVTWLLNGVARAVTTVDVVDGVLATVAELQTLQAPHLDTVDVALLRTRRDEVWSWFEMHCNRSFVPRLSVAHGIVGNGPVILPDVDIRALRWVRHRWNPTDAWTEDTSDDYSILDAVAGVIDVPCGELEVGYEHGLDSPPPDVVAAAAIGVRLAVSSGRIMIDNWGEPVDGTVVPGLDTRPLFGTLKRYKVAPVLVS